MDDVDHPSISLKLEPGEASALAAILLRLAALIDPNDPDGLRDAHGKLSERLAEHALTNTQFGLLHKPPYPPSQRDAIAKSLRIISARIEGQLPDEAPDVGH